LVASRQSYSIIANSLLFEPLCRADNNPHRSSVLFLWFHFQCYLLTGGLTTYSLATNFLECIFAKNYENWLRALRADKVMAMKVMQ